MTERIWTTSNVISCSRIVLLGPFAYCFFSEFEHHRLWAGGILLLGALTDFLDGFLARRLHQVSEFGKVIDPLADKIAVGGIAIMLVLRSDIPAWYFVVTVVRDLLIVIGGISIRNKKKIITQSNWPGKVAVSLVALYLLMSTVQWEGSGGALNIVMWSSVVMMTISLGVYTRRLFIGRNVQEG